MLISYIGCAVTMYVLLLCELGELTIAKDHDNRLSQVEVMIGAIVGGLLWPVVLILYILNICKKIKRHYAKCEEHKDETHKA